jgi:hypothetical protein
MLGRSNCSWVYSVYSEVFYRLEFLTKRLELFKSLERLEKESADIVTELNSQRGTATYDYPLVAENDYGAALSIRYVECDLLKTQKYIEEVVRPELVKIVQSRPESNLDESVSDKELFVQADKISWENYLADYETWQAEHAGEEADANAS